jgi:hypothetical protein
MASNSTVSRTKQPVGLSATAAASAEPVRPLPDAVTDLDEICAWLGTYRERLRAAHLEDRETTSGDLTR